MPESELSNSQEPEAQFQMLFTRMLDGFALHEMIFDSGGEPSDYRFLAVNPAFEELTGLSAAEVVGKTVLEVLPNTERTWIENYGRVARTGEPFRFESSHAGLGKHFEVIAFRPRPGQFACIFRDITERKVRQAEIERLTHLYAVLSQVNQAIVRAESAQELFDSICRVAVEFGHFRLAWIGSLDSSSEIVTLKAKETDAQGFGHAIGANDCGIVRAAISDGRPFVCNELLESQSAAECHRTAMESDIRSCAAFPIRCHGRVCAALCLHAKDAGFFNDAETKLLEEVALDISFALDKLEGEAQRKRAEDDLSREMEFNRAVLENIMGAVVACDSQGELTLCNRTARDWFGFDDSGSWSCSLLGPDGIAPLTEAELPWKVAYSGEELQQVGMTVIDAGDHPRYVLASGRAIFDFAGRKLGAVVALNDISEVKRHEAEREATIKLLSLLNAQNNTNALIAAVTSYLQEWSGCEAVGIRLRNGDDFPYYETKGFGADFIKAESSLCVLGPDGEPVLDCDGKAQLACMCGNVLCGRVDPQLPFFTEGGSFWTNNTRQLVATATREELQGPVRSRCMREGYQSVALIPLQAGGEIVGLIQFNDRRENRFNLETIGLLERAAASVATALAQKKAQAALRETEKRLQAIIDQTPALVYVKNLEGQLTLVNHSFEVLFGRSREEFLGKTSHDILPPETASAHRANDLEVLRRRVPVYFEEDSMVGNERRTFLSVKFPLVDASGAIYSICGISTDLTEQKRVEKEKASLEDQLRQAQRLESIGRLAGGIAHDFNNLLTVINGYGDLLLRGLSQGDPFRAQIEEICKAGERATGLTQQLLAFSRKQVIAPKPLQLNSLISQTRNMLRRLIGEDIELNTTLDPSLDLVMGDEGLLHQVLMNLAVNSRDAMPGGGVLTLETSNFEVDDIYASTHTEVTPGRYVLLSVADTGVGFDESTRQNIFEPFFTTKDEGKGTGLGLSTVYGIVRQFGGWISAYSEPGHGATFKIFLPAVADQIATLDPDMTASESLRGSETILVVEDQDDVRHLVASVLQSYGYRVLEAAQGGDALLLAERHPGPIHLMLSDVVMPRMTGRELAERVAPLRPEMRVLFMSGYTENTIAHQGVLDSGIYFIPKPFTPGNLAKKVREVLGEPRKAASILVIDGDSGVRNLFQQILSGAGYEVLLAVNGKEAIAMLSAGSLDLIITDMATAGSTAEFLNRVRAEYPNTKLIGPSSAQGKGLKLDATLSKPVSPKALLQTVRNVLL